MKKKDLESIVTQMCGSLMDTIHNQEDMNKEQIIQYLKSSMDVISHIDETRTDSIEYAKSVFHNAYKDIASKSISSYKSTNQNFEQLTKKHNDILQNCLKGDINVPVVNEKLNDIQTQMVNEVKKANDIIANLTIQIEKLEKTSKIDPLTKVFNKKALNENLKKICMQKNLKHELHLLILDIDDFKIINDTYGHLAGDKILIFITNILRKTLRESDKIFRFGGEEFVIILNRISTEDCKSISNRMLSLISNNRLIYKGQSLQVTASMGGTVYYDSDTPDSLLDRADKGLYRAKTTGKNKMCAEVIDGI
jgi:diguanylate cyclase (GGDEF)-like protein